VETMREESVLHSRYFVFCQCTALLVSCLPVDDGPFYCLLLFSFFLSQKKKKTKNKKAAANNSVTVCHYITAFHQILKYIFTKNKCDLYFLNRFNVLILKIIFKK
jgi:hypothetical protein